MTTNGQPAGRPGLEQLIAQVGEGEDLDQVVLRQVLHGARLKDPELPGILRACAIPRAFDVEVLGVLRRVSDDPAGDQRLFDLVREYRFVLPRENGTVVYHDNTRDALLADWRSTEPKRARLAELSTALSEFYQERFALAERSERHLKEVSSIMLRVNPGRLHRLTGILQSELTEALLGALYHALLASVPDGFGYFETLFFRLEESGHLDLCQSMVSFTADHLRRLPPDEVDPVHLAWLEYFGARIGKRAPGRGGEWLAEVLTPLLARDDLPAKLRLWALDDLGDACEKQLKMRRALEIRRPAIGELTGVDVYNEPLRHRNFGGLCWMLGDTREAFAQYRIAIDKADGLDDARTDVAVLARGDLSSLYQSTGDWSMAFELANQALCLARSQFPTDELVQQWVAHRYFTLLASYDPQGCDSAAMEAVALTGATEPWRSSTLLGYAELLQNVARTTRAQEIIDDLGWTRSDAEANPDLAVEYYRTLSALRRQVGEERAAMELNELTERTAELLGARRVALDARANRALNLTTLGLLDAAVEELRAVADEWNAHGCPVIGHVIATYLASSLLKGGRAAEAAALLQAADLALPADFKSDRALLDIQRGKVARFHGQWQTAIHRLRSAARTAATLRESEARAVALHELLDIALDRSDWELVAEYGAELTTLAAEVAARKSWRPSAQQREAVRLNAEGMRCWCDSGADGARLDRARDLFRSAVAVDPDGYWQRLNLSFSYARQEDWQGAVEELGAALDRCPEPMRTPRLYRCLLDHSLRQVAVQHRGNDLAGAAATLGALLDRVTGHLPAEELRRAVTIRCVIEVLAGDLPAARADFRRIARAWAADPERDDLSIGQLIAGELAPFVRDVPDYWALDDAIADVSSTASGALEAVARATRAALVDRLSEVFGLDVAPTTFYFPVVPPILVDIGDDLVPYVDSALDGGHFLYELVPAMRARILARTGLSIPGVRVRQSDQPGPSGYLITIEDALVDAGQIDITGQIDDGATTGQIEPAGGTPIELSPGQLLTDRIECMLTRHLASLLGVPETSALLSQWRAEDPGVIGPADADPAAVQRLTWVLRALLRDRIPIDDWRSIWAAIQQAGGLRTPLPALVSEVRWALRDRSVAPLVPEVPAKEPG